MNLLPIFGYFQTSPFAKWSIGFICAWLVAAQIAAAQNPLSNIRCSTIPAGRIETQLDSLSVNPESIKLPVGMVFQYDLSTGILAFEQPLDTATEVCYQVFPFSLHKPVYFYDLSLYYPQGLPETLSGQVPHSEKRIAKEEFFATNNLNKSGSLSRGVTFGNTNNLGVNSSLNLQLDGQLADNLFINAVITDQQVPFQPEGNTQQLQDFDKVLVNLYNDQFSLQAGDVVLKNDSSYFLRYYKNTQGGQASYRYKVGDTWKAATSVTASLAKGKFSSTLLEAVEGLSGPYRLRGPDGERYIIVMANSERVYLDGELLSRGFNEDYVIDYNLGEITFNANVLITKFSRIRVDFEYAIQNFSRSVLAASHRQTNGRVTAFMEVYREKDNPLRPLGYDLNDADKLALAGIGDNTGLALIPGVDSVGFSENRILYARVDTVDNSGNVYSVYKYSSNRQTAVYQVSFSQVAAGNYRQLPIGLNGKAYEWVAPVDGVPQGNYEPFLPVVTPNSRQMIVAGVNTKMSKHETIFAEWSASQHDKNLFSELDKGDDRGWGQKAGISSQGREVGLLKGYRWNSLLSYEWNQRFFRPVDRFREIEFDRDWSYTPIFQSGQEPLPIEDHIVVARAGMEKAAESRWNYQASFRNKGEAIDGWQHRASFTERVGKLGLHGELFDLKSTQGVNQSDWNRKLLTTTYQLGKLEPGYTFRTDRNSIVYVPADSVVATAMNFLEHMAFVQLADTTSGAAAFRIDASRRIDQRALEGALKSGDLAYTANMSFGKRWGSDQAFSGTVTYRQLEDLLAASKGLEKTVQGRVNWQSAGWERAIRSNFSAALLNGRELRREYIFIEVIPGQGTHTWRDDNGDGVQDLNEFYEAINSDERTYAKIFVPTDNYVAAYQTILNYSIELGVPMDWRERGGLQGFLSKISNVSSVLVDRKTQEASWAERLDVWSVPGTSANELAYKNAVKSRMFFNRGQAKYGFDIGYQSTAGRQLLTGGWEARNRSVWQVNTRNNLSADWAVFVQGDLGETLSSSDVFSNRNYLIADRQIRPQLQWMPYQWLRLTASTRYASKQAKPVELSITSTVTEYQLDWQMSRAQQSTVSGYLRLVRMDFTGEAASPLGYEMLEALSPGSNYTWRLQWQQRLKNGLRLQLGYDGRKSPEKAVIHFGGVQVTALF